MGKIMRTRGKLSAKRLFNGRNVTFENGVLFIWETVMRKIALTIIGLGLAACQSESTDDFDQRTAESRAVTMEFRTTLKGELQTAMKAGGPVNAIQVCNTRAPAIAAGFSEQKGWTVARTSLKYRNPDNAPDAWERKVLEQFEERKANGEDPKQMVYAEVVEDKGTESYRFMKAIATDPVCLACHGEKIDAAVEARIQELYPEDRARGFNAGDIRGAFTITQPM
jgi:hypothetical protein